MTIETAARDRNAGDPPRLVGWCYVSARICNRGWPSRQPAGPIKWSRQSNSSIIRSGEVQTLAEPTGDVTAQWRGEKSRSPRDPAASGSAAI